MIGILLKRFLKQIAQDSMLLMAFIAPFLAGIAFRLGLPFLNTKVAPTIGLPDMSPWWIVSDLFLAILAPFMICFSSSMVLLEERDEGVAAYILVTPAGKTGYLFSRLVVPALFASIVSALILIVFNLSNISLWWIIVLPPCMGSLSIVLALLVVSFSKNRVEGMAVAKIAGLLLLGIPLPFFISGAQRFYASFLPSFWIAEAVRTSPNGGLATIPYLGAFLAVLALWWKVLYPRFARSIVAG